MSQAIDICCNERYGVWIRVRGYRFVLSCMGQLYLWNDEITLFDALLSLARAVRIKMWIHQGFCFVLHYL